MPSFLGFPRSLQFQCGPWQLEREKGEEYVAALLKPQNLITWHEHARAA